MHILAFETTGPHCSVAIIDENGNLKEAASMGTMNHLQHLMPLTRQLLEECQLQLDDIKAIAVSVGPGSFTGIRIGVSSARGLAQVLGCKVIPVETLKTFPYHDTEYDGLFCPIFDARRNQVYGGAYAWQDGQIVEAVPGGPYMLDEYLLLLESALSVSPSGVPSASASAPASDPGSAPGSAIRRIRFFGDGLKPYGQKVADWAAGQPVEFSVAPEEHRYQEAGLVARLGLLELKKGKAMEYALVFPNYMRKAEAQKNLEDRLAREADAKSAEEKLHEPSAEATKSSGGRHE